MALVAILYFGRVYAQWQIEDATAFARGSDLSNSREELIVPFVGCAIFCACAGWATFAPAGRHSFAFSLVVVFAVSVVLLWVSTLVLPTPPPRYKSDPHPLPMFTPPIAVFLFIGPVIAAAGLTVFRVRRTRTKHAAAP